MVSVFFGKQYTEVEQSLIQEDTLKIYILGILCQDTELSSDDVCLVILSSFGSLTVGAK